jgi:choloylglycine hydrolase
MLWLSESDYGVRDEKVPGLSAALWAQYYLDNFSTVKEAVQFTRSTPLQVVTGTMPGGIKAMLHLSLADATGDSAIIEYIGGKPRIYHDRKYTVMTNSPPFEEQLAQLRRYKGFGGDELLPGTTEAADRFVRAAFYLEHLPKPKDYRECVAGVLSVMRNVAQPFGEANPNRPYASATRWRTVADTTSLVYFFESTTSPNIVWVQLKKLDFSQGAPVRKLDLIKKTDRVGDCSGELEIAKPFVPLSPDGY